MTKFRTNLIVTLLSEVMRVRKPLVPLRRARDFTRVNCGSVEEREELDAILNFTGMLGINLNSFQCGTRNIKNLNH